MIENKESLKNEIELASLSFNDEDFPDDDETRAAWLRRRLEEEVKKLKIRMVRDEAGNIVEKVALNRVFLTPEGLVLEDPPLFRQLRVLGAEIPEAREIYPPSKNLGTKSPWKVHEPPKSGICPECGRIFEKKRINQIYCGSPECNQVRNRKRVLKFRQKQV